MTRLEFHKYFKIALDKNAQGTAYGGSPSFLPEEIDYWLDTAYYQIISNKFTGNNPLKQPFEQSVKRISDLQNLIRTDKAVSAFKETGTNACYMENLFNGTRMFFVDATLNFNCTKANIKLLDHATAQKFKQTSSNIPWIEDPVGVIEDNKLYVLFDPIAMSSDAYTIDITYVKTPTMIEDLPEVGMQEVPDHVQFEIIDRAVLLALDDIESKRTQIKSQLNQLSE